LVFFRIHPFLAICIVIFCLFWIFQLRELLVDLRDFWEIKQFYNRELIISEEELQTIQWTEIVSRLIRVPRLSLSKERMTHLDIANRIMRKENYLIAMINKDILNLEVPFISMFGLRKKQVVTKTLEWGLSFTIFSYVFDNNNNNLHGLNRQILDSHRA
jgi:hypothetical protein